MSGAHLRRGATADGPFSVAISPDDAGWAFSGLRVLRLAPRVQHVFASGEDELVVLPLSGACSVELDGEPFVLDGRDDPLSAVTDLL